MFAISYSLHLFFWILELRCRFLMQTYPRNTLKDAFSWRSKAQETFSSRCSSAASSINNNNVGRLFSMKWNYFFSRSLFRFCSCFDLCNGIEFNFNCQKGMVWSGNWYRTPSQEWIKFWKWKTSFENFSIFLLMLFAGKMTKRKIINVCKSLKRSCVIVVNKWEHSTGALS